MKSILQVLSLDLVSKVVLGVLGMVLIRYMPGGEYAHYTLAVSAVAVVTQTLTSTYNRIYIVGYERLKLGAAGSSFLGFQLLSIAVVALLALPLRGWLGGTYGAVVAVVVATCLSEYAKTAFQQEMRFGRFSIVEVARSALWFAAVAALIAWRARPTAPAVLLLQALAMTVVFLVAFRKRLEVRGLIRLGENRRFAAALGARGYKYLFAYFALLAVLSQLDVFMLRSMVAEHQLATYGSAFRYYTLLSLALGAVHAVLLPMVQRVGTRADLDGINRRNLRMLMLFAPVVAAGAFAARWIIPMVDGGRYPGAVGIFEILAASAVVSFAFSPYVHVLMRFEDFQFLFWLVVAALALHVVLNLFLIRAAGGIGAAIATLVTYGFINGSTFVRMRRRASGWWAAEGLAAAQVERLELSAASV